MKQVWRNCHAATMQGGAYSIIERAAIVTEDGRIAWIGPEAEMPLDGSAAVQDLGGAWVTPGLVDCHTHLVFGGNRSLEFEQRLQGVDYAEIARARRHRQHARTPPGRRAVPGCEPARAAPAARRRDHAGGQVGLRPGPAQRAQDAARGAPLGRSLPLTVRATCLAAHALPPEFTGRPDDYIDEVARRMLPVLAAEGLVDAVDAFCEHLAFSPAQVERVFQSAAHLGLPVKLHAEQLSSLHGATLAARHGALSADHLEYLTESDAGHGAGRHRGGAAAGRVLRAARNPAAASGSAAPPRRADSHFHRPQSGYLAGAVAAPDAEHGLHAVPPDAGGRWPAPPSMGPARWDWRPRMARWKRARRRTSWPGASIIRRSWPTGLAANCPGASSGMGSRCTRRRRTRRPDSRRAAMHAAYAAIASAGRPAWDGRRKALTALCSRCACVSSDDAAAAASSTSAAFCWVT